MKRSAFDFSQVHIARAFLCYLLLFDSLLVVYEGLCGEISKFFADRPTDDRLTDKTIA